MKEGSTTLIFGPAAIFESAILKDQLLFPISLYLLENLRRTSDKTSTGRSTHFVHIEKRYVLNFKD